MLKASAENHLIIVCTYKTVATMTRTKAANCVDSDRPRLCLQYHSNRTKAVAEQWNHTPAHTSHTHGLKNASACVCCGIFCSLVAYIGKVGYPTSFLKDGFESGMLRHYRLFSTQFWQTRDVGYICTSMQCATVSLLHLYLKAVRHSVCYICTSMQCATVFATSVLQCCAPQSWLHLYLNAVRHSLCFGEVKQICVQLHGEGDGGR